MKKANGKLKAWLGLACVALVGLVLTGCPHNNLLDGGGGTGGRSGNNDGVRLIVTNFVGGGTNRSVRTIAPDNIDLKDQGTVDKYIFVVEGESTSGEIYGPEYVTIDGATGAASLGISGSDVWTVTLSAYDVDKLQGKPDIQGTSKADIMAQTTDVSKITAQKDVALVLQGKATLDLWKNTGGTVTITLSNDGVGTVGNVLVKVNFDPGDYTKLHTADYKVKFSLYDFDTGALVLAGTRAEQEVEGGVLVNPQNITGLSNVPKGRYQFRVTVIENTGGTSVAYWADDIIVEGNRDVTQEVFVSKLFETPDAPSAAGVYWSQKETTETREGFLGYLSWEGMSFNAVGVDVQIANITKWYKFDGGQDKIDFTGAAPEQITAANVLWEKIDALGAGGNPRFEDVVTELKWSDVPQKATKFPVIYKEGSLLNGSPGVVFLMQTGQVYSVRVRAAGGQDNSDWVIVDQAKSQTMTEPEMLDNAADNTKAGGTNDKAHKFNDTKLNIGIFDLVMLKYNLQGRYELAKTAGTGVGATKGAQATVSDLVVYKSYGENLSIELKYTDIENPVDSEWFMYPLGAGTIDERLKGWKGWKGVEDPSKEYVAPAWGDYEGYTDLTLVAVGAGAGINVQAETAGTFNVLDENIVLISLETDGRQVGTVGFTEFSNGAINPNGNGGVDVKTTQLGIQKDAAGNRYILNVDKNGTNETWLYLSVGSDPAAPGTLDDKNGGQFAVKDIKVTLIKNGITVMKSFTKGSEHIAYAQMDGIQTGTYTLRVEVLGSSGYWISYQTALAIKNNTQVIR